MNRRTIVRIGSMKMRMATREVTWMTYVVAEKVFLRNWLKRSAVFCLALSMMSWNRGSSKKLTSSFAARIILSYIGAIISSSF